jgi:hypothetical protein
MAFSVKDLLLLSHQVMFGRGCNDNFNFVAFLTYSLCFSKFTAANESMDERLLRLQVWE